MTGRKQDTGILPVRMEHGQKQYLAEVTLKAAKIVQHVMWTIGQQIVIVKFTSLNMRHVFEDYIV